MIREARPEDMEACIDIQHSLFGNDKEKCRYYFKKDMRDKDFTTLVSESKGKIIGLTRFQYRRWNNIIYLYVLYIAKGSQGRGLGSELLSEILKKARALKVRKIFLDTISSNKKAIEFYKKKGFKKAGFISDYYSIGKDRNALILSLDVKS